MKKSIALLLSLALMLTLLVGCGGSKIENYSDEEVLAAEKAAESARDKSRPVNAYPADTVVCTVNGRECTWDEYFYWLNNYRISLENSIGPIEDWDALNQYYTSNTNEEVVRTLAQSDFLYYALCYGLADDAGVATTAEEAAAELETEADSFLGDGDGVYSDEEKQAFEDYLAENDLSYDVQLLLARKHMSEQAYYYFVTADYTDEDVMAWAGEKGYMSAKHILFLTVDNTTREALTDEEIAAAKASADALYDELSEAKAAADDDPDALVEQGAEQTASAEAPKTQLDSFLALFDDRMIEKSEDSGLATHPDGYVFLPGEMVAAFETAVQSLDEEYGMSEVVESDYGYHIILRQPLSPEAVLGQDSYGYDITLRTYALNNLFSTALQDAETTAVIEWAEGFEAIDLAALFASAE